MVFQVWSLCIELCILRLDIKAIQWEVEVEKQPGHVLWRAAR